MNQVVRRTPIGAAEYGVVDNWKLDLEGAMTRSGLAVGPEPYDEFSLLCENAVEAGIPADPLPPVRRIHAMTDMGSVSALHWGAGPPRVLLLHGAGQNAHTWDTVLMAVGVPALAVDLPGHGHSAWRSDRDYSPASNAGTIAQALAAWRIEALPVVGMSLGGLTTLALAGRSPKTPTALVLVDVTPSVFVRTQQMTAKQRGTATLAAGPAEFHSLDDMVQAAATAAPQRPEDSLRRGVLHNSRRLPDGRWTWRYDRYSASAKAFEPLWDDVSRIDVPVGLIRGGDSGYVTDEDIAKFAGLCSQLTVETVPGAGHSVHSDRPREFAGMLERLLRLR